MCSTNSIFYTVFHSQFKIAYSFTEIIYANNFFIEKQVAWKTKKIKRNFFVSTYILLHKQRFNIGYTVNI